MTALNITDEKLHKKKGELMTMMHLLPSDDVAFKCVIFLSGTVHAREASGYRKLQYFASLQQQLTISRGKLK